MERTNYLAIIHKDKGSDFGVSFPDFPGCFSAGSTLPEAVYMASEALGLHVKGMKEDGEVIPAPSAYEDIVDQLDGGIAVLVPFIPEDEVKRVNITVTASRLEEIDRRAAEEGMSRSTYMVTRACA